MKLGSSYFISLHSCSGAYCQVLSKSVQQKYERLINHKLRHVGLVLLITYYYLSSSLRRRRSDGSSGSFYCAD